MMSRRHSQPYRAKLLKIVCRCACALRTALAVVMISGCTMIPRYERPAAPVPAAWPEGPAYKETGTLQGAAPAAEMQWDRFFADERLRQVIAAALQGNRDLRLAALRVERARALYRIQRAELLPTLDGIGSAARQRTPGSLTQSGNPQTSTVYSASLGIAAWEIDFFGRIRSLEQSALEQYCATEQARRGARTLLISEVAGAYITLAADRESLQLARYTLESQLASYRLVLRRHEVGLVSELDLLQAQTRLEAARGDIARYTALAAQDENALNLLAGATVPAHLLPDALSDVPALPDVSPGLSSEVLLQRPDVLQAEALLRSANANIGAARAALFPRIALTGALGTASGELSGLFHPGTLAWNYGAQIVQPIFDPRLWAAVEVTQVDRRSAVAQYEGAIQAAFRDVADALARRGTLGDELQAQQALVEAAAAALRLSTARYEKGTDIYLNVLDAQRSLYASQQGLIAIRLAALASQVRLYAALGGGAEPAESAPSAPVQPVSAAGPVR